MGQLSSAIEKREEAVKDFRGPSTSTRSWDSDIEMHLLSPQGQSITRKISNQNREPTSSDDDRSCVPRVRMIQAANVEPVRTILPFLPTEVLLFIAQFLPPSSLMSLTYTCRTIRSNMDVSIEHSLGKKNRITQLPPLDLYLNLPKPTGSGWSLPTVERNVYHSERLKLLCMLDHDQIIPPGKAVCSGCADVHDRSLFSDKSLAQSSGERLCLGTAGRIWICPHWTFDHNLITTSAVPRGTHTCSGKGVMMVTAYAATATPIIIWPLIALRDNNDLPSKKLVEDILDRMNMSVCKHLQFTDPIVSRLYSPVYLRQKRDLVQSGRYPLFVSRFSIPGTPGYLDWLTHGKCESCGTKFHFCIGADHTGQKNIQLVVERKIAAFLGCTDRDWIEQVTDPAEFEGLEQRWYAASCEDNEPVQDTSLVE